MCQWENVHHPKLMILASLLTQLILSYQPNPKASFPLLWNLKDLAFYPFLSGTATSIVLRISAWQSTWLSDNAAPPLFQFALLSRGDTFLFNQRYWLVSFHSCVNKGWRVKSGGIKMIGQNVLVFVSGLLYWRKFEGNFFPQIFNLQPQCVVDTVC